MVRAPTVVTYACGLRFGESLGYPRAEGGKHENNHFAVPADVNAPFTPNAYRYENGQLHAVEAFIKAGRPLESPIAILD
jgi:hypothetical protein